MPLKITNIHKAFAPEFNKSQVALSYYKRARPDKEYDTQGAINFFIRDPNIDFNILNEVIFEAYREQVRKIREHKQSRQIEQGTELSVGKG